MATITAERRRAEAKFTYDAYMAQCPTRQVMSTVGDKWGSLLITALADGPKRHGELRTMIGGISQKMLTQTLRELERDGLVTRTVTASVPLRVDYALTPLASTLVPVLKSLKQWSEANIEAILTAREGYDARDVEQA